jgi:hypothetical protein
MALFHPSALRLLAMPIVIATMMVAGAHAQEATAPAKPKYDKYGSPLDTIRNTRLWTDVPPAEGFVRETRPNPKDLDYTPLTGVDPVRPKPRDAANVQALQAELERDGKENQKKAAAFGRKTASATEKPRHRKARSSPVD